MLILSRRPGERIILVLEDGRRVEILVSSNCRKSGNYALLGIDAPKSIRIYRVEAEKSPQTADAVPAATNST